MLGLLHSGEQGGDPGLQAGQGFVPGREHPGGDQDVSKVVGAASAGVGVERGVADRCGAGGEVGQHGSAGTVAQPVQCGARGGVAVMASWTATSSGGIASPPAQQLAGAATQRAALASMPLVELVLEAAVDARVGHRQPGAVGAGRRVRAGRGD